MREPLVLAVETTCDETSLALLKGRRLETHLVYSQTEVHARYKGVVPEAASRAHSEKLWHLLKKISLKSPPDAVAFSRGPGLLGSLIVGRVAADAIAEYFGTRFIGVNHLEGHLLACELEKGEIKDKFRFPLTALIISGGHSELWKVKDYGIYSLLGATRDDAAGEAFDKTAKLMGLPYPGGPLIERLAAEYRGQERLFPVPEVEGTLEFSFSGLKTAVAYYIKDRKKLNPGQAKKAAFSFQSSVVESLLKKTALAVEKSGSKRLAVCGGVSANKFLRKTFSDFFGKRGVSVIYPEKKYCTDNSAMIAACAFRRLKAGNFYNRTAADSGLVIKSWRKV